MIRGVFFGWGGVVVDETFGRVLHWGLQGAGKKSRWVSESFLQRLGSDWMVIG